MNHIPRVYQCVMIDILMIARRCSKRLMSTTLHPPIKYPGVVAMTTTSSTINCSVEGAKLVGINLGMAVDHRNFEINFQDHVVISVIIDLQSNRSSLISQKLLSCELIPTPKEPRVNSLKCRRLKIGPQF